MRAHPLQVVVGPRNNGVILAKVANHWGFCWFLVDLAHIMRH